MSSSFQSILVAGGAGFIGSNFVHYLRQAHPSTRIVVVDKLTYAGNVANLKQSLGDDEVDFVEGDIADQELMEKLTAGCDGVVNFAAESHNDRALLDPGPFVETNVSGAGVLAYAAATQGVERYVHVSTDEVYGQIAEGSFKEGDELRPRSTYPATKASGEMMVLAAVESFGLQAAITRGVNNIGPYQHPEKALPLFVTNAIDDLPLPVYGDGMQVRDRMHVRDHCTAIDLVLREGKAGEAYNVGADNECTNMYMVEKILDRLGKPASLITHIEDRTGHDFRYSVDWTRLRDLGWKPEFGLDAALEDTIDWYRDNEWWWRESRSGDFEEYYEKLYGDRLRKAEPGGP
jgi:dTDP-glucose 4,6-dehydratase